MTIAGTEDDLDVLVDALHEPLESLDLVVRGALEHGGEPTAPSVVASATLWIDMRAVDHVEILVWLGQQEHPVRRSLPRDPARGSRAVLAEDVAYAVRATLESLLAEVPPPSAPHRIASLPAPRPREVVTVAPPAPLSPPDGFGLDAAALANIRGVASSATAVGPAAALDVAFWGRRRFRPTLWITGAFDATFTAPTPSTDVTLKTTIYSLRALADFELAHVGPLRFAAGLGYGADFFRIDPTSTSLMIQAQPATTLVDPTVAAQLVGRARLFERAGLILVATLDYDTAPHHYQETEVTPMGPSSVPVFAPWTLRPAVYLGLCFRLTGASGCAGEW